MRKFRKCSIRNLFCFIFPLSSSLFGWVLMKKVIFFVLLFALWVRCFFCFIVAFAGKTDSFQ